MAIQLEILAKAAVKSCCTLCSIGVTICSAMQFCQYCKQQLLAIFYNTISLPSKVGFLVLLGIGTTFSIQMIMSNFGELIKSEFPKIDDDLYGYVEGMCYSLVSSVYNLLN